MKKFFSKFGAVSLSFCMFAFTSVIALGALTDHYDITTDQELMWILQHYYCDYEAEIELISSQLKSGTDGTNFEQFSLLMSLPNGYFMGCTINDFRNTTPV